MKLFAPDLKIRPEDLLDESVFRNRGSSLVKGVEPDIVANADTNLAEFFGLNKKTPQEIAVERHAARTPQAIARLCSLIITQSPGVNNIRYGVLNPVKNTDPEFII